MLGYTLKERIVHNAGCIYTDKLIVLEELIYVNTYGAHKYKYAYTFTEASTSLWLCSILFNKVVLLFKYNQLVLYHYVAPLSERKYEKPFYLVPERNFIYPRKQLLT